MPKQFSDPESDPEFVKETFSVVLTRLIEVVFIIAVATIVAGIIKISIRNFFATILKVRSSGRETDEEAWKQRLRILEQTTFSIVKVLITIVAFLIILSQFGIKLSTLLAGAGITGLIIGFATQSLLRDSLAGFFIIAEDHYRLGDVVKINNAVTGTVEDINLRRTVLRDLDGIAHIVPHGQITLTSNLTKSWSRIHLTLGIDYNADLDNVTALVNQTMEQLVKEEPWSSVFLKPPRVTGIEGFQDGMMVIKILGRIKPSKQWAAAREVRRRLKLAFDKEGIVIKKEL